jgi:hypothetical protein
MLSYNDSVWIKNWDDSFTEGITCGTHTDGTEECIWVQLDGWYDGEKIAYFTKSDLIKWRREKLLNDLNV